MKNQTRIRIKIRHVSLSLPLLTTICLLLFLLIVFPAYANGPGPVSFTPGWYSGSSNNAAGLAWGDIDGDGDLDLAVGNYTNVEYNRPGYNQVYLNTNGVLSPTAAWVSAEADDTRSMAWGDVDGDGDLDLVVGNHGETNKLYLNTGGKLGSSADWSADGAYDTLGVAWGDVDGDGYFDLAVGNEGQPAQLYHNDAGVLDSTPLWSASQVYSTTSIAWGDIDGDGDLDLAVGNRLLQPLLLYENVGGTLDSTAVWSSTQIYSATSIALGDVNGDGWLDLAVGNDDQPNAIHMNISGTLELAPSWTAAVTDTTSQIVWGDIDGNGYLDLVVSNYMQPRKAHLNDGGSLQATPIILVNNNDHTRGVALGDIDGDGDLDLAAANDELEPTKVYLNQSVALDQIPIITTTETLDTNCVAWGDADADGDLDLAVGNQGEAIQVYLNENGALASAAAWSTAEIYTATSLAWGDMDDDGYLDLAVSNNDQPAMVLGNDGTELTPVFTSLLGHDSESVAWGDVDGDGDLDLAVGSYNELDQNEFGGVELYLNDEAILEDVPTWVSAIMTDSTMSVAWGDVDGDGDLDLAVGNYWHANRLYLNQGGTLQSTPAWEAGQGDNTTSVAWGDVDGDGDLDLATGNEGQQTRIYFNQNGMLQSTAAWNSLDSEWTRSIAWGDVDGDGDLDLAVGSWRGTPVKVFTNDGQGLQPGAAWRSANGYNTNSVAWGDMDGDGAPDLAVGNQNDPNHVYLNRRAANLYHPAQKPAAISIALDNEEWPLAPANFYAMPTIWDEGELPISYTLSNPSGQQFAKIQSFYSPDGGGRWLPAAIPIAYEEYTTTDNLPLNILDQDIVTASLFISDTYQIADVEVWLDIEHEYDSDLAVWLQSPSGTLVLLFAEVGGSGEDFEGTWLDDEAAISILEGVAPFDDVYSPLEPLSRFDGEPISGTWQLIIADTDEGDAGILHDWSLIIGQASADLGAIVTGAHSFVWDVYESGFMGQSDNVVLQLKALPYLGPVQNGVAGPYQWPFVSAQTFPFRVRGSQIQVLNGALPAPNATVFRIPSGQLRGDPYSDNAGIPFRTDELGYLQGRGQLGIGDKLVALAPITATDSYTFYLTSGAPTKTGLASDQIMERGEITLTTFAANPLLVFNLDMSLEWNARPDTEFMSNLEIALRNASAVLYDVSNGQAAIGDVRLHHSKNSWIKSDVVMYAQNGVRPRATMGGMVNDPIDDIGLSGVITNAYGPGQIRMGPNWDPFGTNLTELNQDWQRALAHELAHYLLFLPDNYIGVQDGKPIKTDCLGSFMTSTYDDAYSEFLTAAGWVGDCTRTVAQFTTGRTDWETIQRFYPMLVSPTITNTGPSVQPLNVTRMLDADPPSLAQPLPTRFFDLRGADGQLLPVSKAQVYLFKNPGRPDSVCLPLGATVGGGDRIKVRGAELGDRLCALGPYDDVKQQAYMGCIDSLKAPDVSITMLPAANWRPIIVVQSVTSYTMNITVTLAVSESALNVQVFPGYGAVTSTLPVNAPITQMAATGPNNLVYTATVTLDYPIFEGLFRVWVPGTTPAKEAVTQIFLTPPWGPNDAGACAGGCGNQRAWGANNRQLGAPAASGDGQVTIFNLQDIFAKTGTISLQSLNSLPHLPLWLSPVGKGYRFAAGEVFPRALMINYLQRDVPAGNEHTLHVYYLPEGSTTWQRLPTDLDPHDNQATATMPNNAINGQGIYALLSTIDTPPLQPGWNLFGYPLAGSREITRALASIDGAYTSIYFYDRITAQWRLYDATVIQNHPAYAALTNDLVKFEYSQSYWLHATQAITLYLGVPLDSELPQPAIIGQPPATFYGPVSATSTFTPTDGMTITAAVGGNLCGQGQVINWLGNLAYKVQVAADSGNGCGVLGRSVSFSIGGQSLNSYPWDNTQAQYRPLGPTTGFHIYLPVVLKNS